MSHLLLGHGQAAMDDNSVRSQHDNCQSMWKTQPEVQECNVLEPVEDQDAAVAPLPTGTPGGSGSLALPLTADQLLTSGEVISARLVSFRTLGELVEQNR
jgi:hypothetical protein